MILQLISFFVIFMIFILAFALLKFLLYGHGSYPFRTSFESLISTFRSALGEIQFDLLSNSDNTVGYIVGILVAFILVILLLNLLIAVMNEAYDEVKSTAEARWCYMQFRMILRNEQQRNTDKFSCITHLLSVGASYLRGTTYVEHEEDQDNILKQDFDEERYQKEFGSDKQPTQQRGIFSIFSDSGINNKKVVPDISTY